jgi:hypothetical protein
VPLANKVSLHVGPCTLRLIHINDVYALDNLPNYATIRRTEALASTELGKAETETGCTMHSVA